MKEQNNSKSINSVSSPQEEKLDKNPRNLVGNLICTIQNGLQSNISTCFAIGQNYVMGSAHQMVQYKDGKLSLFKPQYVTFRKGKETIRVEDAIFPVSFISNCIEIEKIKKVIEQSYKKLQQLQKKNLEQDYALFRLQKPLRRQRYFKLKHLNTQVKMLSSLQKNNKFYYIEQNGELVCTHRMKTFPSMSGSPIFQQNQQGQHQVIGIHKGDLQKYQQKQDDVGIINIISKETLNNINKWIEEMNQEISRLEKIQRVKNFKIIQTEHNRLNNLLNSEYENLYSIKQLQEKTRIQAQQIKIKMEFINKLNRQFQAQKYQLRYQQVRKNRDIMLYIRRKKQKYINKINLYKKCIRKYKKQQRNT